MDEQRMRQEIESMKTLLALNEGQEQNDILPKFVVSEVEIKDNKIQLNPTPQDRVQPTLDSFLSHSLPITEQQVIIARTVQKGIIVENCPLWTGFDMSFQDELELKINLLKTFKSIENCYLFFVPDFLEYVITPTPLQLEENELVVVLYKKNKESPKVLKLKDYKERK